MSDRDRWFDAPKPGTVPDFVVQFHGRVTDLLADHPNAVVKSALRICVEYIQRHEPPHDKR